jgi:hypothetical protein
MTVTAMIANGGTAVATKPFLIVSGNGLMTGVNFQ